MQNGKPKKNKGNFLGGILRRRGARAEATEHSKPHDVEGAGASNGQYRVGVDTGKPGGDHTAYALWHITDEQATNLLAFSSEICDKPSTIDAARRNMLRTRLLSSFRSTRDELFGIPVKEIALIARMVFSTSELSELSREIEKLL
jgi:hypothetical protein